MHNKGTRLDLLLFLSSRFCFVQSVEMAATWILSTPGSIAKQDVCNVSYRSAELAFQTVQEHGPVSLDYVTFVASENVIICTPCYTAVPVTGLNTHLRTCHYVPAKVRRATIARFDGVPAAKSFNDLVPCPDGSSPLSYLGPPMPGFCCPHCSEGKSINWDTMQQHTKKHHNISAPDCLQDRSRYKCYLQSWTKYSPKYWVVTQDDRSHQHQSDEGLVRTSHGDCSTRVEDEEKEEEERLDDELNGAVLDGELEHDENTEWLRGCKWPAWFAHKPIYIIVAAATLPPIAILDDLKLGL